MTEQDQRNVESVRGFYEAEQERAAPDIIWHVPGHNPVSGVYSGRHEYFDVMPARMAPLSRWDFEIREIMVNGDHVVATFRVQGERKGNVIDMEGAHLFRINASGQVAEGWGFTDDQDALDAFFSA